MCPSCLASRDPDLTSRLRLDPGRREQPAPDASECWRCARSSIRASGLPRSSRTMPAHPVHSAAAFAGFCRAVACAHRIRAARRSRSREASLIAATCSRRRGRCLPLRSSETRNARQACAAQATPRLLAALERRNSGCARLLERSRAKRQSEDGAVILVMLPSSERVQWPQRRTGREGGFECIGCRTYPQEYQPRSDPRVEASTARTCRERWPMRGPPKALGNGQVKIRTAATAARHRPCRCAPAPTLPLRCNPSRRLTSISNEREGDGPADRPP